MRFNLDYDLKYNSNEDCLEFVRENAFAKLAGMMLLTVGVIAIINGGIDNHAGSILGGICILISGACLTLIEDHITIAFEERAIFVDRRLNGQSIGLGSRTVPLEKINSIVLPTYVNRKQEYGEIRFIIADGSITLPSARLEEARKNYFQLIERTGIAAGIKPWDTEKD